MAEDKRKVLAEKTSEPKPQHDLLASVSKRKLADSKTALKVLRKMPVTDARSAPYLSQLETGKKEVSAL